MTPSQVIALEAKLAFVGAMEKRMTDKQLPDDPAKFAKYLRARAADHAPGYDIAIYARPATWLALADAIERAALTSAERPQGG